MSFRNSKKNKGGSLRKSKTANGDDGKLGLEKRFGETFPQTSTYLHHVGSLQYNRPRNLGC